MVKLNRQIKMTVKRYCLYCDRVTDYIYYKSLHLNKCKMCGSKYGVRLNNAILVHFLNKIKKLEELKNDSNIFR